MLVDDVDDVVLVVDFAVSTPLTIISLSLG
jgi:hypothetical protein